jgi:tetratricopeptide (TPR) repeat protein
MVQAKMMRLAAVVVVLTACVWPVGCGSPGGTSPSASASSASSGPSGPSRTGGGRMAQVYEAYARGDYQQAHQLSRSLADGGGGTNAATRDAAAYMAGLSAARLGQPRTAEAYLRRAARSRDQALAADALAELGLLYAAAARYSDAAAAFEQAAPRLSGEAKAQAYFHAASAQQKLGRHSQARANFTLARTHSRDGAFRARVDDELATTGFTLQIGFFTSVDNARRAAQAVSPAMTQRLGLPRIVPATDAQGRPGYLVQMGQFSSYASAMATRQSLSSTALIVPLPQ